MVFLLLTLVPLHLLMPICLISTVYDLSLYTFRFSTLPILDIRSVTMVLMIGLSPTTIGITKSIPFSRRYMMLRGDMNPLSITRVLSLPPRRLTSSTILPNVVTSATEPG